MEQPKIERVLRLMKMMTGNNNYTIEDMAEHFDFPTYYWWAPLAAFPLVAVVMILSPVLIFKNRDTRYGFAEYEASAFSIKNGIAKHRR